jgi:hypothetical protein
MKVPVISCYPLGMRPPMALNRALFRLRRREEDEPSRPGWILCHHRQEHQASGRSMAHLRSAAPRRPGRSEAPGRDFLQPSGPNPGPVTVTYSTVQRAHLGGGAKSQLGRLLREPVPFLFPEGAAHASVREGATDDDSAAREPPHRRPAALQLRL